MLMGPCGPTAKARKKALLDLPYSLQAECVTPSPHGEHVVAVWNGACGGPVSYGSNENRPVAWQTLKIVCLLCLATVQATLCLDA